MFLSAHGVLGVALGTLLRPSWRSKNLAKASWRPFEVVLAACFFKSAVFKDVSNEITTFAVLRDPKTGPKALRTCLALAQTLFETALTLRITFWIAQSGLASSLEEVHAIPPT